MNHLVIYNNTRNNNIKVNCDVVDIIGKQRFVNCVTSKDVRYHFKQNLSNWTFLSEFNVDHDAGNTGQNVMVYTWLDGI